MTSTKNISISVVTFFIWAIILLCVVAVKQNVFDGVYDKITVELSYSFIVFAGAHYILTFKDYIISRMEYVEHLEPFYKDILNHYKTHQKEANSEADSQ